MRGKETLSRYATLAVTLLTTSCSPIKINTSSAWEQPTSTDCKYQDKLQRLGRDAHAISPQIFSPIFIQPIDSRCMMIDSTEPYTTRFDSTKGPNGLDCAKGTNLLGSQGEFCSSDSNNLFPAASTP